MRHVVLTPVYNESKYLSRFIESVIEQSLQPTQLVLIDDNSTDNSAEIILAYVSKFPWIKYIFHPGGAFKAQGEKVVNAVNFGLSQIDYKSADFVSKIDADLELPYGYFENIARVFNDNPRVGIAGGRILENEDGHWKPTLQADYFIRGALKSYRTECFSEIGGLKPVLGWDGLDIMSALQKKWETKLIPIEVKHHRKASSDYNLAELNFRLGISNYQNGSNLFLAIVRSLTKIKRHRSLPVGVNFLKGHLYAKSKGLPIVVNNDLKKFINRYHANRILKSITLKK